MEETKKYQVIIRKKIPYVSEFLLGLLSTCAIILAICLFIFMPPLRSPNEMKVVTMINWIPDYVKWIILYSGIGLLVFFFLYKYLIITNAAILSFKATIILLTTKRKVHQIPVSTIYDIELIDPTDLDDNPKGEFFVIIYQSNFKTLQFKLVNYSDADNVIDELLKYASLRKHIKNPPRMNEPDILDDAI